VNDLVLFELFNHHAAKGDATNAHVMSHNQFRKLLKELNVLRAKFTSAHADIMFKKFVAQEEGGKGHKQQNISKSAQHQQHQGNDTKLEFSEFLGLINAIADEVAGPDKRQAFFNKKVIPMLDAVVTSVNAQKIAAPPRSVRSPGMNDDATEAPTIAKTKEALDKLAAINRNKKQLLQMYDFFANLNKQLDFKGLLAFAKAFDLMPGLFDMAQLQQMFHIVQQGAKSIDCLTKVRFMDFIDRTAQLFVEKASLEAADTNEKIELLLACFDNSQGKVKMASGRSGIMCAPFKPPKSEAAKQMKKTVAHNLQTRKK
jgi:hypothetical protein